MNLESLNMTTLVSMVITLGGVATGKTFSTRGKAVTRIHKLAAERGIRLEDWFEEDGSHKLQQSSEVKPPRESAPTPAPAPAPAPVPTVSEELTLQANLQAAAAGAPAPKAPKGPSIRTVAEQMLLVVAYKDEDSRPFGRTYEEILADIRTQFPGAKTTVACLRWYAVHMRDRDVMPPHRPRAVPKKAEAPATQTE